MRKLLSLFFVLTALLAAVPATAQSPAGLNCSGFDTTNFSATPMEVLQSCTFTTGPYGIVLASATAEVTCGATETVRMYIGTGASPVNGSNFLGSVSSGVLTVTSLVPGFGSPPWTIQVGQTLGPGSGATPFAGTLITGLGTGTGGTGTYTIANGSLSVPGGTNLYTLNPLHGGTTAIIPALSQTACNAGFTITSITGTFVGAARTQYWLAVVISTSNASNQSTWNNVISSIFTY